MGFPLIVKYIDDCYVLDKDKEKLANTQNNNFEKINQKHVSFGATSYSETVYVDFPG
jgi:heterodisulfide reductase subunit B